MGYISKNIRGTRLIILESGSFLNENFKLAPKGIPFVIPAPQG